MSSRGVVAVRGIGDVGSAVAHLLFRSGYPVWISDEREPAAPRRGMAFADACFDGSATLEGVTATCFDDPGELLSALTAGEVIPVYRGDLFEVLRYLGTEVLVDARMRKHAHPESQIELAPLTIGLGPNFEAGLTAHLVIETQWGEELGRVLASGRTKELAGEPRNYGGHARERFIYAPVAGVFRTARRIADRVEPGEVVAHIDGTALAAPLGGILRGLVHDGVRVLQGAKVVEVDPRSDRSKVRGIGERPARIAEGVLEAIEAG
ncbi:MAG TPA: selenium-dependent molybdenum cofactor biosynthesis protein YqeB [Actinomycetota bacterium]|nr:selenium-dependent molybdenum cofactor biosynthesis protein YqeB [Actinomycetota bacterium]